ncbi:hypothetical protein FZEAL_7699 [Fusarium zealandicum]|uniref:Uncharacterized protein n=1 Tax=Fusarium zealandicum TaxID=1053134 RepID=A0A8H4XI86_9HYPO|nr:hypothetical protein FZEAL_7699 [Fusarium zealandicum]
MSCDSISAHRNDSLRLGLSKFMLLKGVLSEGNINDVVENESEILKDYYKSANSLRRTMAFMFASDGQKTDLAIWDNRSVFHTATKAV